MSVYKGVVIEGGISAVSLDQWMNFLEHDQWFAYSISHRRQILFMSADDFKKMNPPGYEKIPIQRIQKVIQDLIFSSHYEPTERERQQLTSLNRREISFGSQYPHSDTIPQFFSQPGQSYLPASAVPSSAQMLPPFNFNTSTSSSTGQNSAISESDPSCSSVDIDSSLHKKMWKYCQQNYGKTRLMVEKLSNEDPSFQTLLNWLANDEGEVFSDDELEIEIPKCIKKLTLENSKIFLSIYITFKRLMHQTKTEFKEILYKNMADLATSLLVYCSSSNKRLSPNARHLLVKTLCPKFSEIIINYLDAGRNYLKNKNNYKFLTKKLTDILISDRDIKANKYIVTNVLSNLEESFNTLLNRINQDRGIIKTILNFDVDQINLVDFLGDETHNKNIGALKLSSDKAAIMYKPRSMAAENFICNSNNSLFSQLNTIIRSSKLPFPKEELGTYTILDQGAYGYCQFLENNLEENMINSKEEVVDYIKKIYLLEIFAKQIGLADLHQDGNVFVVNKCPVVTDGEAVLQPLHSMYNTALLSGTNAGLKPKKANRIFDKEGKLVSALEMYPILKSLIEDKEFQTAIEKLLEDNAVKKCIITCKEQLSASRHRLVFQNTQDLKKLIDAPDPIEASENFLGVLQAELAKYCSQLNQNHIENIRNKFIEDFQNNDVPVFYVDKDRCVYYYNILIAEIPQQRPLISIRVNFPKSTPASGRDYYQQRADYHHQCAVFFIKLLIEHNMTPMTIEYFDRAADEDPEISIMGWIVGNLEVDLQSEDKMVLYLDPLSGKIYYKGIQVATRLKAEQKS